MNNPVPNLMKSDEVFCLWWYITVGPTDIVWRMDVVSVQLVPF